MSMRPEGASMRPEGAQSAPTTTRSKHAEEEELAAEAAAEEQVGVGDGRHRLRLFGSCWMSGRRHLAMMRAS